MISNTPLFDNDRAYREGWILFEDGQLQRLDEPSATTIPGLPHEPVFASDADAIQFVFAKAREGSAYHLLALRLAMREAPKPIAPPTASRSLKRTV